MTVRGTLWLLGQLDLPFSAVVPAYGAAYGEGRTVLFGRLLTLRRPRGGGEYPLTVTWVSPRLLWTLLRAPEDVVIVQELNLTALFAVLSKLRLRRRVVALVEGDLDLIGLTGKARTKVAFRRLVARFVDAFVANGDRAHAYVTRRLGVPASKVVTGWWLAGFPADGQSPAPSNGVLTLLAVGQLIPRKGLHLLLDAIAAYGPCELLIAGEGPERARLECQARELGIADRIRFLGSLEHQGLKGLLRACDLLVFPTLSDLVGRVVVEALSVGTPVAVSCHSGAAGTLVVDGENGLVMDPLEPGALLGALRRAADPELRARLRAGAWASSAALTPQAAADAVRGGVRLARRC
jgi:glycosyltransferase involved in cell wall biosynthesis